MEERYCILIVQPDGSEVFEDAASYRANPGPGTYVKIERRRPPNPIFIDRFSVVEGPSKSLK